MGSSRGVGSVEALQNGILNSSVMGAGNNLQRLPVYILVVSMIRDSPLTAELIFYRLYYKRTLISSFTVFVNLNLNLLT